MRAATRCKSESLTSAYDAVTTSLRGLLSAARVECVEASIVHRAR